MTEPTPTDVDRSLTQLHGSLGRKKLNKTWAKVEIAGGLVAVAVAIATIARTVAEPLADAFPLIGAAVILFAMGGYLAMAGHRSHLYQSHDRTAAYLAALVRSHKVD